VKSIHLICVGKLKEKKTLDLEQDFLKRIREPNLVIHETKTFQEDVQLEGAEVLKKIDSLSKSPHIVALTEKGQSFDSPKFSEWLTQTLEHSGCLIFVIGGSKGHGENLLARAQEEISLSKLTFPHQFARLLFVEQLYRAQTLRVGHPYHK